MYYRKGMIGTIRENIDGFEGKIITIKGWVANKRTGKGLVFIVARDGTGFCQCIVDQSQVDAATFEKGDSLTLESSLILTGKVVKDEKQDGGFEIQVTDIDVLQITQDYPIAKKEHGVEFLMDNRHLWLRSRKQWAIMRIRNKAKFLINQFFQEEGFLQLDSPIFTGNAAEGTTTLFETDFYGQPAYLAQTGQLYGEAMALAFGKIYTFGPTFRAEKSKTRRHLSEFWMIEPEMAFYTNEMNMDLIEKFIRYVVKRVVESCGYELDILGRDVASLEKTDQAFPRITYDDAVKILHGEKLVNGKNALTVFEEELEKTKATIQANELDIEERKSKIAAGGMKKGEINFNQNKIDSLIADNKELSELAQNIPLWLNSARNFEHGEDLGGSDETILTKTFETPIMVYNWPKAIKAFYMKEVDGKPDYVKGVDVLAPEGFGEIVGGSERESKLDVLIDGIEKHGLPMEAFEWFLDLRRYGSVPHAGFGLGFERFVGWICGVKHVREVIPFARLYGRLLP